MLGAEGLITAGAIFYGRPRRRLEVAFTLDLRAETGELSARLHALTRAGVTPRARYEKKCESCSLMGQCMPKVTGVDKRVERYIREAISSEAPS
jgi:CRISPR-associated exonuclease Cas4